MTECRGLVLAAPASSSGKTTVALGLLRLLARAGAPAVPAKSGPDYIDPSFQAAACGRPAVNLDAWAMTDGELQCLARHHCDGESCQYLIVEGAMGVLDGAGPERAGSTAGLASALGLPVVMVLDVSGQADSAVLPVLGLKSARPQLDMKGVILNRLGSGRHAQLVRAAMDRFGIRVFGSLGKDLRLTLPSRHLGLVPAAEHPRIDEFLDAAADAVDSGIDVEALLASASPIRPPAGAPAAPSSRPPGQRISIARDDAFAFIYEHMLAAWRRRGAELSFFSPLNDEPPAADADAVFLPGGYPELHAERIANAGRFRHGMLAAAARTAVIYGECGGYMALGRTLVDRDGKRHRMLGCLPHSTSFEVPKLHLGYRLLRGLDRSPFPGRHAGHEFHFSRYDGECPGQPLFAATDADGNRLGEIGHVVGSVSGSFAHLICALDR